MDKFKRCVCLTRFFFFSSRRRHTRCLSDWSSDVCSSDLGPARSDDSETAARLLQSGKDSYRGGRYSQAVEDLRSAAEKFVGLDEKQLFIDTGTLPNLPQFEESLVYLALAYSKLGRDSEAGDTVE